ncbi:hypothetical protein DYBT9623_05548 [Dyadobacter sp. CECT 9623]|uniref:Transmembrane protein n=1 Tax=Dyadobacter linearis TaxID=2823330 RepID=A0ABM8UYW1_9BACT|nr:hypothetical protein DYBT9623_05548 [Dyadobacter sp. CECT 9623]
MDRLLSKDELQHLLQGNGVGLAPRRSKPNVTALAFIGFHAVITSCLLGMLLKIC